MHRNKQRKSDREYENTLRIISLDMIPLNEIILFAGNMVLVYFHLRVTGSSKLSAKGDTVVTATMSMVAGTVHFLRRLKPPRAARRTASLSIKLFAAFHLILDYVGEVHATWGPSMLPTLNTAGDWCLIDKWHHRNGKNMHVGDLVVVHKPGYPNTYVLKRVLGMSGDLIIRDPLDSLHEYIKVPQGHLWITGDNLSHSTDSRHYGPVPLGLVRGKALAVVYPDFRWLGRDGLVDIHNSPIARGMLGD